MNAQSRKCNYWAFIFTFVIILADIGLVVASCSEDEDCGKWFYCDYNPQEKHNECFHKAIVPVRWEDFVSGILSFVGSSFAVVAGVGGGGLYVPILMLILGFNADAAVPLSKAMILGAAYVNVIYLWDLKVFDKVNNRHMAAVDMNACLLLQPMCLAGTVLGAFLNVILPNILIIVLLCLVLGYSAYKIFLKYLKQLKKESGSVCATCNEECNDENVPLTSMDELDAEGGEEVEGGISLETSRDSGDCYLPGVVTENSTVIDDGISGPLANKSQQQLSYLRYDAILNAESSISLRKGAVLVLMWVVILVTSLVKKVWAGCGPIFWTLSLFPLLTASVVTLLCGRIVQKEYNVKLVCGHKFTSADFVWNEKNTRVYPFFSLLAGLAAGMVGIGGGMVAGPLLLLMVKDPDPVVLTSITGALVLFTASSTTTVFLLLGVLQLDYALFLTAFCLLGGFVGRSVFAPYMDRHNKKSWIMLILFATTVLSCVLTAVQGVYKVIQGKEKMELNIDALCRAS